VERQINSVGVEQILQRRPQIRCHLGHAVDERAGRRRPAQLGSNIVDRRLKIAVSSRSHDVKRGGQGSEENRAGTVGV
jgi:hypothetical protein